MFKKMIWSAFYLGLPLIFYLNILPSNVHIPFFSLNWYRNINNPIDNLKYHHNAKFERNYYNNNDVFFYYDEKGEVSHYLKIPKNIFVSPSNESYFLHHKTGEQISFYRNTGDLLWKFDTFSDPILSSSGNFFVLLSTDQSAVSYYNRERSPLLKETFAGSLILDFTFVPFDDTFYFGTEDGSLKGINNQGKFIFEKSLKSSRYNYIKSVTTSEDGELIGAVHGLEPEMLSLFSKNGEILWQKETNASNITHTDVYIDKINNIFVEKEAKKIVFRKISNGSIIDEIPLSSLVKEGDSKENVIKYLKASFQKGFILLAFHTPTRGMVLLLDKDLKIIWQKDLEDQIPLYVEINPKQNILIQTSAYIYAYDFK